MNATLKKWIAPVAIILVAAGAFQAWNSTRDKGPGEGFVHGNGRIEATEIDVATKLAGRLADVMAHEGAFVTADQPLAKMDVATLQASRNEAVANHAQAQHAVATARAQVALRESDLRATQAQVTLRESDLDAAKRRLARSTDLARDGASSQQELDDDRANMRSAQAGVTAAKAQVDSARAAIDAAKAQVTGAQAQVAAGQATIERIDADLKDSVLRAPRDGRVQFLVARSGEVLGAGGRVMNMVDLSDVYMTFFLPEAVAGRVAMGTEARIVLDAAPNLVIPATISFVSATAQFTPKTVETASEREKLMFRVRAKIDPELLTKHLQQVKTGLPGVAWVKLDAAGAWPAQLQTRIPE
ncbi:MAG: HlyD family efflux transporter periplasmic adaptor subunit [Proteobacteria bacterium]|nr:HlyD family efflux transporter periplasmic adaptor subunit [Pseudomonadota bacterium]MBS0493577.1 HlyD family efflux transporter periplasmic adaptor subunit [Pseudomonadota bacterium]